MEQNVSMTAVPKFYSPDVINFCTAQQDWKEHFKKIVRIFGYTLKEMQVKTRRRNVVDIRATACIRIVQVHKGAKDFTILQLAEFLNINHASIHHYIKTHSEFRQIKRNIQRIINNGL